MPGRPRRPRTAFRGALARRRRGRLKVLFFVHRRGIALNYASVFAELSQRGHDVHLAFERKRGLLPRRPLPPRVTAGFAPDRGRFDGWRSIAWLVRAVGDLARYSDPRFDRAPVLRRRMRRLVLDRLERPDQFDPLARRVARCVARRLAVTTDAELSERVIRRAAALEAAIPTSRRINRYIRRQRPDVVLVSPVVKMGSSQVDFLKSARRLRIPAASCVASWDNLTSKGLLRIVPQRVIVWNELQRREAIELHGIPAARVVATGAQSLDHWFEQRPRFSRGEFLTRVGLDPAERYVLFLGSSPFVTRRPQREPRFVARWIEALRASGDDRLRRIGVLIRPHPTGRHWRDADLGPFENAVVWPRRSAAPVTPDERADFFDSIAHCDAVVGINTTAMIEAAILRKSVLTILDQDFAQETTLHFHYLLEEHGGFLHVAGSLEEHVEQLARVLGEGDKRAEARARFVEAFVRPHGLDRPATGIFADTVEKLAEVSVDLERYSRRLRLLLALDVPLATLALLTYPARRRLRRARRRPASPPALPPAPAPAEPARRPAGAAFDS